MTFRNFVITEEEARDPVKLKDIIINGGGKRLEEFSEEERRRMADTWNRRAAAAVNYTEVKSA